MYVQKNGKRKSNEMKNLNSKMKNFNCLQAFTINEKVVSIESIKRKQNKKKLKSIQKRYKKMQISQENKKKKSIKSIIKNRMKNCMPTRNK